MPTVQGILETALYVKDLPSSADFYRRLFHFHTLLESDRLIALNVADRNVLLLFKEGATTAPLTLPGGTIPGHDGAGRTHFAFSITPEDWTPWKDRLNTEGIEIEGEMKWEGGAQSLYFRDPDQHLVELITPGFWRIY